MRSESGTSTKTDYSGDRATSYWANGWEPANVGIFAARKVSALEGFSRLEGCHENSLLRIDAVHRDGRWRAKSQLCQPAWLCIQDESELPAPQTKDAI
ncbi:hypothetical protein CO652_18405 [Rhizobium sp. H4]|nr:hypothetical protein CO652_18405 [Rhizobium sp. H4]